MDKTVPELVKAFKKLPASETNGSGLFRTKVAYASELLIDKAMEIDTLEELNATDFKPEEKLLLGELIKIRNTAFEKYNKEAEKRGRPKLVYKKHYLTKILRATYEYEQILQSMGDADFQRMIISEQNNDIDNVYLFRLGHQGFNKDQIKKDFFAHIIALKMQELKSEFVMPTLWKLQDELEVIRKHILAAQPALNEYIDKYIRRRLLNETDWLDKEAMKFLGKKAIQYINLTLNRHISGNYINDFATKLNLAAHLGALSARPRLALRNLLQSTQSLALYGFDTWYKLGKLYLSSVFNKDSRQEIHRLLALTNYLVKDRYPYELRSQIGSRLARASFFLFKQADLFNVRLSAMSGIIAAESNRDFFKDAEVVAETGTDPKHVFIKKNGKVIEKVRILSERETKMLLKANAGLEVYRETRNAEKELVAPEGTTNFEEKRILTETNPKDKSFRIFTKDGSYDKTFSYQDIQANRVAETIKKVKEGITWTEEDIRREAELGAYTTQYNYNALPQVFGGGVKRAFMVFSSWPINYLTNFLPEMIRRSMTGFTLRNKLVKPSYRRAPLDYLFGLGVILSLTGKAGYNYSSNFLANVMFTSGNTPNIRFLPPQFRMALAFLNLMTSLLTGAIDAFTGNHNLGEVQKDIHSKMVNMLNQMAMYIPLYYASKDLLKSVALMQVTRFPGEPALFYINPKYRAHLISMQNRLNKYNANAISTSIQWLAGTYEKPKTVKEIVKNKQQHQQQRLKDMENFLKALRRFH